jgi:hypothetical protein
MFEDDLLVIMPGFWHKKRQFQMQSLSMKQNRRLFMIFMNLLQDPSPRTPIQELFCRDEFVPSGLTHIFVIFSSRFNPQSNGQNLKNVDCYRLDMLL